MQSTEYNYDVIIIGGSYAGLSAAMALGRSTRKVLLLDTKQSCNRFTPHSHNFIGFDGSTPALIRDLAREQVLAYPTVHLIEDKATTATLKDTGISITSQSGQEYVAKKLIIATGLKDNLPNIKGIKDCWGKSVLHCPYCHGYEVRQKPTAILATGETAMHYAPLIKNLSNSVSILSNGPHQLENEALQLLQTNGITLIEKNIIEIVHKEGQVTSVRFEDDTELAIETIYHHPASEQQSDIAAQLGCDFDEQGLIVTNAQKQTNIANVFACGDAAEWRSVPIAVASGNMAGAVVNMQLCQEDFHVS